MTPADAADAMRQGSWIVWEPGDGTRSLVQTYVLDELDRGVVRRRWQAISSAFFSGTVTRGR